MDEVVTGKADFRAVIDGVADAALQLIKALLGPSSGTVDLTLPTPAVRPGRRRPGGQGASPAAMKEAKPIRRRRATKVGHPPTRKAPASSVRVSDEEGKSRAAAPTAKMVAFAQSLARGKNVSLPEGYERDFKACRRFLDEHAR